MSERISICCAAGLLVASLLTGCVAPGGRTLLPEPRPLGAQVPTVEQGSQDGSEEVRDAVPEPTGMLGLKEALAASLMRNPEMAAFSYAMRAAEARILQAGVLPNPQLEFEVEEYDRRGEGFDSAETAVVLAQPFELGGKRRWRKRIAEAEAELAGWDYESKRLDIFAETSRRFVEVLATRERLELARSAVELAEKTSCAVAERVKAGKEPPLQAAKSEAELELARLGELAGENALGVARKRLAAMWGAEAAAFDTVEGSLDHVMDAVPSLGALRVRLAVNPDLARWEAELRLRRAAVAAEKAARIPDLEASVGFLQFEEDGTEAFAFGLGMPLPVFDRNRGNITAAQHELAKAESELSAATGALAAELAEVHSGLTTAHQRVGTLRSKVVPAMEQVYQAAHEGYQQGKFGFLDMLDAQRGLFEARALLVDALHEYQAALIDIQRITATGIDDLNREEQVN